MIRLHDERVKQVAIGVGIVLVVAVTVVGLLLGWRSLPGLLGQWIGTMMGIMMTPFFLEASFVILGFIIVIALNVWRRQKDGEELVYLEQIEGPGVPRDMPDQAKWAIFKDRPLKGGEPTLLEQAEGAFALGDYATTAEWISEMNADELHEPDALKLRRDLALATGKMERARELEEELRKS